MVVLRRPLAVILVAGGACLLATQTSAGAFTATAAANAYKEYPVAVPNGESGEPSIGWVPSAKAAIYGAGLGAARLTWDDSKAGSPMTAKDVTPTGGQVDTLDTIVTVDPWINRTFFAELAGVGSTMWYSDDAGASWTPSTGIAAGALLDHESIGVGPFAAGALPHTGTDAVYYCAQNGFSGACGVSLDGGLTFSPGVPTQNTPANDSGDPNSTLAAEGGACSALHGHLKVGPDGTAYLPFKGCGGTATASNLTNSEYEGGHPAVSVSPDNGQSWTVRVNPDGDNTDESDNSIAIGPKNTLYMTWEDGKNISDSESAHLTSAKVSLSFDEGRTWMRTTNLDPPGIHNVMFPVVTVGDDDRAAVAFLGTSGIGDDQQNGFIGMWDLFVSTTYDQGRTWTTVDATAGDPVHRGCIDNQGIAPGSPKSTPPPGNVCDNRNMLDFNDIAVDSTGRVLVAYTKTCTKPACLVAAPLSDTANLSDDTQNYVLRQSDGKGLLAAFDGTPMNPAAITTDNTSPVQHAAVAGSAASIPNTSSASSTGRAAGIALLVLGGAALLLEARRRRHGRGPF